MRVTLKDISRETGLSISTVSRALSRSKRTHTDTENVIFECATKLGYPFFNLKQSEKKLSVALVTDYFEGEFYASLFQGFCKAACSIDAEIFLFELHNQKKKNYKKSTLEYLVELSKNYSAICLFHPELGNFKHKDIIAALGDYPVISLNPIQNPKLDTVTFDSYSGGYIVAKHFFELGYKKMGVISGPTNRVESLLRKNGFTDYISQKKGVNLVWDFKGDYTEKYGVKAFHNFKKSKIKDVAIFSSNDYTAFGFINSASQSNYSIPNDFIIAGYDDMSFCKTFNPMLTSVNTDYNELGRVALMLIKNRLEKKHSNYGHLNLVPVSLKQRNSTKIHT